MWCAECAEGLGAFRKRRVSIDLQYSLESLDGGQISLGCFFFIYMYLWEGMFVCRVFRGEERVVLRLSLRSMFGK